MTTPNPTAESVIADAITAYWADEERSGPNRGPVTHDRACGEAAAEALRDHGLLSEGAPTEEQITRAHRAYYEANPDGGYRQAMRAALTAAGVAPQEPQQLDAEKVAEMLLLLMRDEAMLFDNGTEEWIAESDPVECLPSLARALCEAYKEGKLT